MALDRRDRAQPGVESRRQRTGRHDREVVLQVDLLDLARQQRRHRARRGIRALSQEQGTRCRRRGLGDDAQQLGVADARGDTLAHPLAAGGVEPADERLELLVPAVVGAAGEQ